MTITCDVWSDEKTEIGRFDFAEVPRAGDTISVPHGKENEFRHYRVDTVSHRASGKGLDAETFLFVSTQAQARDSSPP